MTEIQPTPEDYEAARQKLEQPAREMMLEIFAKQEARERRDREAAARRRRLIHRFLTFGRAA